MVPVWHKYFNSCAALLFVVDVTAHDRLAEAVIELLQVLQHPDMQASCQRALHLVLACSSTHMCMEGRLLMSPKSSCCVHTAPKARHLTWRTGPVL